MVQPRPGQGPSQLLCPGRVIRERAGDVSKVAGGLRPCSFVLSNSRGRNCLQRESVLAELSFGSLDFSAQLCPLMGGNVRGPLMSFFTETLLSQARGLDGWSLTIRRSCLISINLYAYKGSEQQDFTSLSALEVVMQGDGSLGASCAPSCRKLGDYWKSASWELLGSSAQDGKGESSFKESVKGMREAEREQRKAKGLLQGQDEVMVYVSKRGAEQVGIDDPAATPGASGWSFLRTVCVLLVGAGENDVCKRPLFMAWLEIIFCKVLHLSGECSDCWWADSLPAPRRETASAGFTTAANSLGGSTKNTLHLERLDDSLPGADENHCYFFEGNFQEVLKISIIRGVGFRCNIHHSFELLVNPVCFLQHPHVSLWK